MDAYQTFQQQFLNLPVQWGDELDELMAAFELEHYEPGGIYQNFGQPSVKIGYMIEGLLHYLVMSEEEEKTIFFFVEGQYVADMHSLVYNTSSTCRIEAMEPTDVLVIPYRKLQELYDKYLTINRAGRLIYEQMLAEVESRLISHVQDSPEQRYIDLLEQSPHLFQRIPQRILASFLGVTPISLSRIKKRVHEKKTDK